MRNERIRGTAWRHGLLAVLAPVMLLLAGAPAAEPATGDSAELSVPLHEAVYHATARGIPVRATLRLERQGERMYLYSSLIEPRGIASFIRRELTETSLVMIQDGRILPLSYRRHDGVGGRHSDMRFDLGEGQLHIDYRGEQTTLDWEPGIYDVLSLRLLLANDVARGELHDVYRIVDDRGRIEKVDIEVGAETLSTPLGELETVRLEYRSERRDRLFRVWIAPGLHSALVRLEQYEEGKLRGRLDIVEYQRL
ncbi:MAG: DUF3108 domain-containing protein [Gammaproteobacteria bacterium]